jgi:hypothetical protein
LITAKESPDGGIVVRLQIFSGRPDPTWVLEGSVAQDVAERLRSALKSESVHTPPQGGLGYRGFRITGLDPTLPQEVEVFSGVIIERTRGDPRGWPDANHLERVLLEQARERGFGNVLEAGGAPRGGER